jgi:hypothetical protein
MFKGHLIIEPFFISNGFTIAAAKLSVTIG